MERAKSLGLLTVDWGNTKEFEVFATLFCCSLFRCLIQCSGKFPPFLVSSFPAYFYIDSYLHLVWIPNSLLCQVYHCIPPPRCTLRLTRLLKCKMAITSVYRDCSILLSYITNVNPTKIYNQEEHPIRMKGEREREAAYKKGVDK